MHKLISPHGDDDHLGELPYMLENFKINNVIFNCGSFNELEKKIIKILDNKNIN